MADGGITALAGYLYQILGVLGMRAWAQQLSDPVGSTELEALLLAVQNSKLRHEYLDQDAALRQPALSSLGIGGEDEYILIQFKFSRQFSHPTIGKQELEKIAKRFRQSNLRAQLAGQNVTKYFLVTNRHLGHDAQTLLSSVQLGRFPADLQKDLHSIFQRFYSVINIQSVDWEDALKQFGHAFGCRKDEIEDGIDKLIGNLFHRTGNGESPTITEEDIIDAFTGYRHAHRLSPIQVAKESQKQVERFAPLLELKHAAIRRSLLDQIAQQTQDHALVILHGLGGCGKTVVAWQMTQEIISTVSETNGVYATILSAHEVRPCCLSQLIGDWANLPVGHKWRQDELELALERLNIASFRSQHPILYLSLDALDENQHIKDSSHLQKVIDWFWSEEQEIQLRPRPPRATLVVTARDENELLERWVHEGSTFSEFPANRRPPSIIVGDFMAHDLLQAAQLGLPKELHARFEQSLFQSRPGSLINTSELPFFQWSGSTVPTIDELMLQTLHHPVMWRSLLELEEPATQSLVLDGDPEAIRQLAAVFVRRFCKKALLRGQGLDMEELVEVLSLIADACIQKSRMHYTRREWMTAACSSDLINQREAAQLYREAQTAGLISKDNQQQWRWRHQFVCDYLAHYRMSS